MSPEKRRADRILLNEPVVLEPVDLPPMRLHDNLASVYERVEPVSATGNGRFEAVIRDLSTNGAFLTGEPVPLLTRLACSFELDGFGRIETIGWTLWRRDRDCEIPRGDGTSVTLPRGFGILFEAISLDARIAIHERVAGAAKGLN